MSIILRRLDRVVTIRDVAARRLFGPIFMLVIGSKHIPLVTTQDNNLIFVLKYTVSKHVMSDA